MKTRSPARDLAAGALVLGGLLAAAGAAQAADLRVAVGCPPIDACGDWHWAVAFQERLAEHGVEAELILGGALGPDPEVVDQLSQGLVEVGLTNYVMVRQFEPMILGFITPYMFDDLEHLFRAIDESDIRDRINGRLADEDLVLAAILGVGGPIGIFNTRRPVASAADMAGLRMRAIDASQLALFEAWGTQGVVVDMAEVATALQSGVIDGYINPPLVAMIFQHTDFFDHYTEAGAGIGVRSALVSRIWLEGLDEPTRAAVEDAVAHATEENRAWTLAYAAGEIAQLEAAGVEVTILSEEARADFAERSRTAWEALMPPEHIELFLSVAEATRR